MAELRSLEKKALTDRYTDN